MLGRFVIFFLIWLSWLSSGIACSANAAPLTPLGGDFWVAEVRCDQWERSYDGDWIAEGEADVEMDDIGWVPFRRVIVTDRGTDLYQTLECFCRAELDGGVDFYSPN